MWKKQYFFRREEKNDPGLILADYLERRERIYFSLLMVSLHIKRI